MIAATVLAAGDSARMGSPKALLDFQGATFLERILSKLREVPVDITYVTVGRDRHKILKGNKLDASSVIENKELNAGPIGSIRSVLRVIPEEVEALLIWPVDMPHVQTETARLVVGAKSNRPIVVPVWRGSRGHPIWLKREVFGEILQLSEGDTMRSVVRRDANRVHRIEVDDSAVIDSINTPEDYATFNARHSTLNIEESKS